MMPTANVAMYAPAPVSEEPVYNYYYEFLSPVELSPLNDKIIFLNKIREIKDNWDGYGAKAPNPRAINNAITFMELLPPAYQKMLNIEDISFSPYGTIILEWQKNEDNFISIEIGNSKIGYLSETPDKINPYSESIEFTLNEIPKEIFPVFTKVFS